MNFILKNSMLNADILSGNLNAELEKFSFLISFSRAKKWLN